MKRTSPWVSLLSLVVICLGVLMISHGQRAGASPLGLLGQMTLGDYVVGRPPPNTVADPQVTAENVNVDGGTLLSVARLLVTDAGALVTTGNFTLGDGGSIAVTISGEVATTSTSADGGPQVITPYFPACADFPCVSPDAGTDWACPEAPGATVQIVSFAANVNYRSTPGPDAGLFAYVSDNAVGAPAGYRYTLTAADTSLADGGAIVIIHLSAVDASASLAHCP